MKAFQNKLNKIGKEIIPSKKFRDEARFSLMEKIINNDEVWFANVSKNSDAPIPSAKLKYSFLSSLLNKEDERDKGFWGWIKFHKILATVSAFILFMVFTFSIYVFPISAEEKTYISSISGIVEIGKIDNDEFKIAHNEIILDSGSKIRTGENSNTEIIFFEDSIIRLDSNTEIEIQKLLPNAFFGQIGDVVVNLNFGKIWVKSFGTNKEYSAFEVHSGDIVVFPQKATFDLHRDGNLNSLKVFERSVKVSYRGVRNRETLTLISEKQVSINLRGMGEIIDILPEYKVSSWVVDNLQKDKIHIDNFIKEKTESISNTENFSDFVISLKPDSADKFFNKAENSFRSALRNIVKNNNDLAKEELKNFTENLKKAIDMDSRIKNRIGIFVENENKYLQFITPENNLYIAKQSLQEAKELIADNIRIVKEENAIEKLWETKKLVNSQNQANRKLAVNHLETFVSHQESEEFSESSTDPEMRAELLDKKSEELQIISKLSEKVDMNNETVDKVEEKVISDVIEFSKSEIVRPGFPGSFKHETIEDYLDKIKIYKTAQGQENMMREILRKVDNNADNLMMLRELKEQSPQNVKSMVTDKMLEIIRAEKQKAVLEAN